MNMFLIWVLIILCFCIFYCNSKNYCSSSYCNNTKKHVFCQYQSPGPAINCTNYAKLLTTAEEKIELLHKINSRRNKVASGEIRSLPAAENMAKLIWNKQLEDLAQRLVDQCVGSTLYNSTDLCTDLENMSVGQNIATVYGEAPGLTATSMIDLWYMELLNVNVSILSRYVPSSLTGMQHYDYFTQLVWSNTYQVGCAGVKFKEINYGTYQNKTIHRLVCNFAPAGNILDESVYNFGVPCRRCNFKDCDAEFTFLCSSNLMSDNNQQKKINDGTFNRFSDAPNFHKKTNFRINSDVKHSLATPNQVQISDTQFDYFSDLFEITQSTKSKIEQSTTKCKDVLAVDEFIELLKNRLSNDRILKDLLLSSTKLLTPEPVFSDRTVAAIIKQLYSKKESPTTTKSSERDSLNSTLLVDLVEAVIFRQSGKYPTTESAKLFTQSVSDVRPVKIQAELAEVKSNKEFTGHYFFPEEEEQTEQETDEMYDESLPTAGISLEIEVLKRKSGTKGFLEEILESDYITESTKKDNILPNIITPNGTNNKNLLPSTLKRYERFKRKTYDGLFFSYSDFLKKLANDLRELKLHEKFNCCYNSIEKLDNYFSLVSLVCIYYFLDLL